MIKLVNGRAFTQRRAASVESKSVSSLICVPPCQRGLGYGSKPAFCLLDRNKTCYVLTQPGVCLCLCVALRSGAFWVKLGFLQLCFALDSSHAKAVSNSDAYCNTAGKSQDEEHCAAQFAVSKWDSCSCIIVSRDTRLKKVQHSCVCVTY